jgi:bisphosphoglycerate-dependent phosphoglycerate mutase
MLRAFRFRSSVESALLNVCAFPFRINDYQLNERHYGALPGYVKQEVEDGKYGHDEEQVADWRRSWCHLTYWSKFFFNCSYAGISFVLSM